MAALLARACMHVRTAALQSSPTLYLNRAASSAALPVILKTDPHLHMPKTEAGLVGRARVVVTPDDEQATLIRDIKGADILLTCYSKVTEEVLDAAGPQLRGIIKYGVGIDAINCGAAIKRGIKVCNIPWYAEDTVAEGTFAMMISLAKKLPGLRRVMVADGWAWTEDRWLGWDLAGRTVGIIGVGKIGGRFAEMCSAFKMNVVGFDPNVTAERMAKHGAKKANSLSELLAMSDVVSTNCTLNETSALMIGPNELAQMKNTAMFLNSSRGGIVQEQALVDAVLNGTIGGCGVDVFSEEPILKQGHVMSPLLNKDNVFLSPHLTFWTEEAMERLEVETLDRCLELVEQRPLTVFSNDPRLAKQEGVVYKMHPAEAAAQARYGDA